MRGRAKGAVNDFTAQIAIIIRTRSPCAAASVVDMSPSGRSSKRWLKHFQANVSQV